MKSAAGYYIGREYEEEGEWFPYDRLSDYYNSPFEAINVLEDFIVEMKDG